MGKIGNSRRKGQALVELALLLPILLLIVYGALELGRAFFAIIAITNAAREGTRVYTFRPDVTTIANIVASVNEEIGNTPLVDPSNIDSIVIECGDPLATVASDADLAACAAEESIRITITYTHEIIFNLVFPQPIPLTRSAEMMVP